ncbi:MAG TPA: DUF2200 domain-containing protein [Bryobacteraceae bacterium]|nr:DUF2200 domain-containing protein [Bryobacteraceae bacterium]
MAERADGGVQEPARRADLRVHGRARHSGPGRVLSGSRSSCGSIRPARSWWASYNEELGAARATRRILLAKHRIFSTPFAKVYPMYVQKAERKGRTQQEVDQIICWLTGYDQAGLRRQIERQADFETFFAEAPAMNPRRLLIEGVVCGVRVEEIADPLMREIRYLDKLIDELAKGRPMEKILRQPAGTPTRT